jgi:ComF family protein
LNWKESIVAPVINLFYPHQCLGCGNDIISDNNFLCVKCIHELPSTNYALNAGNPVERLFWGRIPVVAATSEFYFSKMNVVQNMIHEFKYRGNKQLGHYLGAFIGKSLEGSNRFDNIDFMIPVPLHPAKEFKRGFNQSAILCKGIHEFLDIPIMTGNVVRKVFTESQTRKNRIERWINVSESFAINQPELLKGKSILIVDDVITTGGTIEACATQIAKISDVKINIASLAIAES